MHFCFVAGKIYTLYGLKYKGCWMSSAKESDPSLDFRRRRRTPRPWVSPSFIFLSCLFISQFEFYYHVQKHYFLPAPPKFLSFSFFLILFLLPLAMHFLTILSTITAQYIHPWLQKHIKKKNPWSTNFRINAFILYLSKTEELNFTLLLLLFFFFFRLILFLREIYYRPVLQTQPGLVK